MLRMGILSRCCGWEYYPAALHKPTRLLCAACRVLLCFFCPYFVVHITGCQVTSNPNSLLTTIAEAQKQSKISTDVLKLMLPCPGASASADAFVQVLNAGFAPLQIALISHAFALPAPSWRDILAVARTSADPASKDLILHSRSIAIPGQAFLNISTSGLTPAQLAFLSRHIRVVVTESDFISLLQHPLDGNQLLLLGGSLEPVTLRSKEAVLALYGTGNRMQFAGRVFIGDSDLLAFALKIGFGISALQPFVGPKQLHAAEVFSAFQKQHLADSSAAEFLFANADKVYLDPEDLKALCRSSLSGIQISQLIKDSNHPALQIDPVTVTLLKLRGADDSAVLTLMRTQEAGMPSTPEVAVDPYKDPLARLDPVQAAEPKGGQNSPHSNAGIYHIGGDVSAPVLINKVEPEYTEEARAACIEGTVILSVVIDAQGLPRDIHVRHSLDPGLDTKAIQAIMKWRFRPGMRLGRAVATQANAEVNFRLLGPCHSNSQVKARQTSDLNTRSAKMPPAPQLDELLLGVQVVQVQWNTSEFGANGFGRANLVDGARKQGFDFTFSCSRPFLPSEGSGLYPARWKKRGTRLVITTTEIGNPKKHASCELKVGLQPFAYEIRSSQLVTVPLR